MSSISSTRWLRGALVGLSVCAIVWGTLAFGAVYPWAYTPLAVLCAFVGITAAAISRPRRPPILGLALALAAIGIGIALQLVPLPPPALSRISPGADAYLARLDFSYAVRQDGAPDLEGVGTSHPVSLLPSKTIVGLGLYAAFAAFLVGLTRLLSLTGGRQIVAAILVFGVALALFAIGQHALGPQNINEIKIYGFWKPRYYANPFGPFVNRNHFAGWTIMVLPLALCWAYSCWETVSARGRMSARERLVAVNTPEGGALLLMLLAAIVMSVALFLTGSRSGMAALGIGGLLCAWLIVRRQRTARAKGLTAGIFVLALAIAAGWAGIDRIVTRSADVLKDGVTAGGRRQAWTDTVRIIRDFPLTGTGLNTYGTAMIAYQTSDRALHFQEAHNDYLQIAAEGGVLLGFPVGAAIVIVIRDIRRRFREAPKRGTTYWIRVGAVIGIISIAAQSLVEFSLQMPGNAALFCALMAVALHQSPSLQRLQA